MRCCWTGIASLAGEATQASVSLSPRDAHISSNSISAGRGRGEGQMQRRSKRLPLTLTPHRAERNAEEAWGEGILTQERQGHRQGEPVEHQEEAQNPETAAHRQEP